MNKEILLTDDPVYKIGRNPNELGAELLKKAGIKPVSPMQAIRARCIDCANTRDEVAKCTAIGCALWAFRMGSSPFRAKRDVSEEQRAAARDRMKNYHETRKANIG